MAEHKVPQDVEAEDKLIGPLSFRQFIYAMIALAAVAAAYFLATMIAMPLAAIPMPVIAVFGVLAIPRKGQPMEVYIGALIHFYFQPRTRIWDPDGQEDLVEITSPTIDAAPQIKDIGGSEAAQRLSFLADIEDTQGWSTRGNTNLNDDFAAAADNVADVFEDTSLNRVFDNKLAQTEQQARDAAISRMTADITTTAAPAYQAAPAPTQPSFVPPAYTPPAYVPPAAPTIVTPPPVYAAPAPVVAPVAAPIVPLAAPIEDEAALSAMLKQTASNNTAPAFQQTVVQPLGASPVINNPTLTTTAGTGLTTPVTPAAQTPASNPTPPTSQPAPIVTAPATTAPESATIDEVISHDSGKSNNSQDVEISLR